MSFRAFLLICVITALCVSVVTRFAGWSEQTDYVVGMGAMVVMMLACFPFMDPAREYRHKGR